MFFKTLGKSLMQLLMAAGVVVASALSDGHIDEAELLQIAVAFTAAVGVYLAPNLPGYPWIKTAVAAVMAALMAATGLITDGLTSAEVVNIVVAFLGVLATGAAPAISDTKPPTVVN